jgi:hypothetical protein
MASSAGLSFSLRLIEELRLLRFGYGQYSTARGVWMLFFCRRSFNTLQNRLRQGTPGNS